MPAATHSYTVDALKGQAVTKQLHDTVTEIQNRIGQRLFEHAMSSNGCVEQGHPRLHADLSEYHAENTQLCPRRTIYCQRKIKFC